MTRIYELFKSYASLIALLGMSFVQVLNLRPSDRSLLAFISFTLLAILAMVNCAVIVRQRKLVKRGTDFVREHVYGLSTRRAAAAVLILAPPVYVTLSLLFHIPNTWPILVRAGAESRDTHPWMKTLPGRTLLGLDREVGVLFVPRGGVVTYSSAIHRVTIYNRSTVPSPPLELSLALHSPNGPLAPRGRVFAVAVASPSARPWNPIERAIRPLPASPEWLLHMGSCKGGRPDGGWCFFHKPDVTSLPAIRLPSIPPRDSLEVYLEFALPEGTVIRVIPATLTLRQAAEGEFPVYLRRDVDLNSNLVRG